jgi:cell wall assembly regulator SMI1
MPFEKFCNNLSKLYKQRGAELERFSGATQRELKQAEKQLGHKIDQQLRAAWAISNGGADWQPFFARPGFFTGFDFLAIEEALDHMRGMRKRAPKYKSYSEPHKRDSRIQTGWYQDGWLPFASFSGATMLLIMDHAPSTSGCSGQVIAYIHDPDTIEYVAPDFSRLLKSSLKSFKSDPEEFFIDE